MNAGPHAFVGAQTYREPPHNTEAEQGLLGSLLMNNKVFEVVAPIVSVSDFSEIAHQRIFEVCSTLITSGRAATPVTLRAYFADNPYEDGGLNVPAYLAALVADHAMPLVAKDYAQQVHDLAVRRRIIEAAQEVQDQAYDLPASVRPAQMAGEAIAVLHSIAGREGSQNTRREAHEAIAEAINNFGRGRMRRISTGFSDLDAVTEGYQPGTLWVVAARPGGGKALALDTPIPTPNGWTTMGALKLGSVIYDEKGQATRVMFATPVMIGRPCYRVVFDDGEEIIADADHRWATLTYRERRLCQNRSEYVRNRSTIKRREKLGSTKVAPPFTGQYLLPPKPSVRTTEEIRNSLRAKTGHLNHAIDVCAPLTAPEAYLPVPPYTLGAWLGDGTAAKCEITCADQDVIQQIGMDGFIVAQAAYQNKNQGAAQTWTIRRLGQQVTMTGSGAISPLSLTNDLRAIGVWKNKHIPQVYLRASVGQRRLLLAGLMDTDGHADSRGRCEYTGTNKALVLGVRELLLSLGQKCTMTEGRATINGRDVGPRYRIIFTPVFQVFKMARKANRLKLKQVQSRYRSRFIVAVEPVESVPVRCIQVDSPNSMFLCGRAMIPTHNTVLAATSANKVARAGHGAMLFSLEVPEEQMRARVLADLAYDKRHRLSFKDIMSGEVAQSAMGIVEDAYEAAREMPLVLDVSSRLTPAEIRVRVRAEKDRMAAKGVALRVIFLDYLKQIQASDRYKGNRVYEIGEITYSLKQLAKDEGICVVLLAQLNRQNEQREDKRPTLSDLRESGDLETDADVVAFIHREAYYIQRSAEYRGGEPEAQDAFDRCEFDAEIILGKNRIGPATTINLFCDIACSTMSGKMHGDRV